MSDYILNELYKPEVVQSILSSSSPEQFFKEWKNGAFVEYRWLANHFHAIQTHPERFIPRTLLMPKTTQFSDIISEITFSEGPIYKKLHCWFKESFNDEGLIPYPKTRKHMFAYGTPTAALRAAWLGDAGVEIDQEQEVTPSITRKTDFTCSSLEIIPWGNTEGAGEKWLVVGNYPRILGSQWIALVSAVGDLKINNNYQEKT